ncbi:barstar family protein [Exiguobacterium sp. S90]|uniref:barstar family protein n=1 Tax=Exiguobacterium sp. S90 TaxID=1221231 RepID=UPI001BE5732C|nr:barstar family protein [Exiguobacterium sp. S90]
MKTVEIDVTAVQSAVELHRLLKQKLVFPGHYGENWDAFWDLITGPEDPGLPDEIIWIGFSALQRKLPKQAEQLLACLDNYHQEMELHPCVSTFLENTD